MVDKRFHIHVICSPDDQVKMLDGLVLFLENQAFITHDLLLDANETNNYSRRCIDNCDYLMMIIGDSYGFLNKTGVSQLHLSYIYAKTKAKPILTLLKLHNQNAQISRQLSDFISMVESQNSQDIYYFDDDVQMHEFFEPAYRKFTKEHKRTGWIRATATNNCQQLLLTKVVDTPTTQTSNEDVPDSCQIKEANTYIDSKSLITDEDYSINLDVEIMINFSTNAYQDGNLSSINLMAPLTWRQILKSISDHINPMTISAFHRTINELIQPVALALAKREISPNIHAVSRTQVSTLDLQWIQSQMLQFGWLAHSENTGLQSRLEFLELTNEGIQKLTER